MWPLAMMKNADSAENYAFFIGLMNEIYGTQLLNSAVVFFPALFQVNACGAMIPSR